MTGTYGFSDRKRRFKDRLTTSSADEAFCVGSRSRKAFFACVFVSLLLGSKRNRDSTWTRILLGCLVVGNLFSFPRASFVHGLIYRDPKDTAFFGHRPSYLPTNCAAAAEVQGKSTALTARGAKIFDHRETSFHSSFFEEEDDYDEPERYNGRRCAIFFGSIQHRVREKI